MASAATNTSNSFEACSWSANAAVAEHSVSRATAIEALDAAVEGVRAIVLWNMKGGAIQHELASGDSIGETTDRGAEICFVLLVPTHIVVCKHDVGDFAVAVWNLEGVESGTVADDDCFHTLVVGEDIAVDRYAVFRLAKFGNLHFALCSLRQKTGCENQKRQHGKNRDGRLSHESSFVASEVKGSRI